MKLWGEEMGAMYAREFALSVVAARIGWMVRDEREGLDMRERSMMRHYISRGDVAHFMACAIETPDVPFSVLYAMGPAGADSYDLDAARSAIGYEPRDYFPAGLPFELPPEGE
jgi:hypothetical protein